uniref:DNA polymerase zeta catalytic subunit n=1 Tax=Rhizophora mucronata TaxID=61149 RepID=A0A2P2J9Z3_RHIMU
MSLCVSGEPFKGSALLILELTSPISSKFFSKVKHATEDIEFNLHPVGSVLSSDLLYNSFIFLSNSRQCDKIFRTSSGSGLPGSGGMAASRTSLLSYSSSHMGMRDCTIFTSEFACERDIYILNC